MTSKPGFTSIVIAVQDLGSTIRKLLDLEGGKTFSRLLLGADVKARYEFLYELGLWDGSIKTKSQNWSYCSTNLANIDLVHEMAILTGLRASSNITIIRSGKSFGSVNMRTKDRTFTKTFRSARVPYKGHVHCVTMPHGTVIVRRNGKVCVTSQSQQEPRILAHFDGGQLMKTYQDNPWVDVHDYAKEELEKMGKFYDRKPVKNTNLGLIYGMGTGKLAERNDMSVKDAGELKDAIMTLYPGLKAMYRDMRARAKAGIPIRTWGGREYYCEPPKIVGGRIMSFDYKLVNVLIQGSAADCTKEAIIRTHVEFARLGKSESWHILLNVHDQIACSVPKKDLVQAMEVLRVQMESVEFDVLILSEGSTSSTNWAELKDYDKKGRILDGS